MYHRDKKSPNRERCEIRGHARYSGYSEAASARPARNDEKKRYTILQHILISGVVGRRTLAVSIGSTERVLRGEVDFLKEQGLLQIDASGMRITDAGRVLLEKIEPLVKDVFGLTEWEELIRDRFGLKQVVIVPGDSEVSPHAKKELGRAGALVVRKLVKEDEVIAVTGGSTMAQVPIS